MAISAQLSDSVPPEVNTISLGSALISAATQDGSEVTAENSTETASGQKSAGEDSGEAETASSTEQKIDLNTADVSQLTTLTGVGESKALAIIAYREENGPFNSAEDIMNVPGIKEGTYEKIKDKIAIE